MTDEFIHPNWHVILIHYPIGLVSIGVLIELVSVIWRSEKVRSAGRWMLLFGILAGIPAMTSGIYALRMAVTMAGGAEGDVWRDTAGRMNWSQVQWAFMLRHIVLECAATALLAGGLVYWIGCSDRWRKRSEPWLLAAGLICVGLVVAGAWHAGESIYLFKTGVPTETTREDPSNAVPDAVRHARFDYFFPPLQLHVVLVGAVIAAGSIAMGLAIRRITQPGLDEAELEGDTHHKALVRRFWGVTVLMVLATGVCGFWAAGVWRVTDIWGMAQSSPRSLGHMILGALTLVLVAGLAAASRWAPRSRAAVVTLAGLLVLTIAAQFWIGTLLTFDTGEGSITAFNAAEAPSKPATISAGMSTEGHG